MASIGKSKNSYYRSDDLKRPFDNIKEAMGLTGNADSNYLTNLGKVSRWEGTEMDNREKNSIWESLQDILPGMSGEDAYTANLGLRNFGHNREKARTEQALRGDRLRKAGSEADSAESKADIEGLRGFLAQQIAAMGPPVDKADYDTSNPNEMRPYEDALENSQLNPEILKQIAQRFGILGDKPHTTTTDVTGTRGQAETGAKIRKEDSLTEYNKERKKYVGILGDKNVKLVEARIDSLKGMDEAKKLLILNKVMTNLANLHQNTLTQTGKRLTDKKRQELIELQMLTEIEKELTQEEKTENAWLRGVDIETGTDLKEEKIKTQEQQTAKATSLASMSAQELDKLPQKLKDEAAKRTKELEKLDKDILKLEQQTRTSASREDKVKSEERLVNAKRLRENVKKDLDRKLADARKILIDTQAGNWGTRTYNALMYPNKHEKKVTATAAGGTKPGDGRMTLNPNGTVTPGSVNPEKTPSLKPQDSMPLVNALKRKPDTGSKGSFGVHNIMKNLEKYFSGGEKGGWIDQMVGGEEPKPLTGEGNKILASLQGENTAGWKQPQIDAFVKKVVAQSGGTVSPEEAKEILKQSMSN